MSTSERTTPTDTSVPADTTATKKIRVPAPKVDWTVMVFMVGDNNLEEKAKADLAEIEKAGSSENVTVIAQMDLGPSGGSTKRYVINPHSNNSLDDDVDEQWPESRPEVLRDFLHWCIKYHPAERYMLLLWGHGRALDSFEVKSNVRPIKPSSLSRRAQPKKPDDHEKPFFIICPDDEARHAISNKELRSILASVGHKIEGGKIHVLGLVACLMGMFEMCYELREGVHYMIASESLIPSTTLPFDQVIPFLIENSKMNEEDLCRTIVREFKNHYLNQGDLAVQLSAFDLTKADELREKLDDLADLLRAKITVDTNTLNAVLGSHFQTQRYDEDQFFDLYDFCYMLKQNCLDAEIGDACQQLMQIIGDQKNPNFVIASEFNGDGMQFSYGLAIYFPWGNVNEKRYRTLVFAGSDAAEPGSTWLQFLNTYVNSISKIERSDRKEPYTVVAEWLKDAPPHLKNGDETEKNLPTVNVKKLLEAAVAAEWLKDAPPHLKNGDETKKNMPTVNTKKLLDAVAAEWLKDAPPHLKNGDETKKNMPTVGAKKRIEAIVTEWMKDAPPHLKNGDETRKNMPTVGTKKAEAKAAS